MMKVERDSANFHFILPTGYNIHAKMEEGGLQIHVHILEISLTNT